MSTHSRYSSVLSTSTFPRVVGPNHQCRSDTTRLYSIRKGGNQNNSSFLSKIGKKVKSALPTKWFGSDEEKLKRQRKIEVKKKVSSSLDEALKDAPLAFKMMGKMLRPIFSAAASRMAETMAQQQQTTAKVLEDAQIYLQSDPAVTALLGDMIQVGAPSQQSLSSTMINGAKQSRVEMALPISGQLGSGVARLLATQDGIAQLQVEAAGSLINVDLTKKKSPRLPYKSKVSDDNIIEAEIVDKETKY
jgi:hypothetical protein